MIYLRKKMRKEATEFVVHEVEREGVFVYIYVDLFVCGCICLSEEKDEKRSH